MTIAIIGVGNIGKTVAEQLVAGGETVVLAANDPPVTVANELGPSATAATVADAVDRSDTVIFAVWFDVIKKLVGDLGDRLSGKVIVDPSNPVAPGPDGNFVRTLPDGVSAGSIIADLVPASAHYVKAFGTLSAEALASGANHTPNRVVLFYATNDDSAGAVAEQLIRAAGFDPLRIGGVDATLRIEVFGDLHDFGGLNGRTVDLGEARGLLAASG
jgi:8-hydroxy-5-deazaflavin:NADPH oxidoreductase